MKKRLREILERRKRSIDHSGEFHIADVCGTYGIEGYVKVIPLADVFEECLCKNPVVTFYKGKTKKKLKIIDFKEHSDAYIVRFEGVNSKEFAEIMVDGELWVDRSCLPERTNSASGIIGFEVFDTEGRRLGTVGDVVDTPAGALLSVVNGGRERFIPFVEEFVRSVDTESGRIVVELVEGM